MRASVKLQVISHKDVIVNRQRNMILEFSKVQQIFFFYLTSKRQFSSLKMTKLSFRLLLLIQTRGESNHSSHSKNFIEHTLEGGHPSGVLILHGKIQQGKKQPQTISTVMVSSKCWYNYLCKLVQTGNQLWKQRTTGTFYQIINGKVQENSKGPS